MQRVMGVIQARSGSSRLPGKVLLPLAGRPVLEWVIRAAKEVHGLEEVIVATTTEPGDDEVENLAVRLGVRTVRGSVDDVLGRFLKAVDGLQADAIARFTSDCPLLDPEVASVVVGAWRALPSLDHVSTVSPRCLPRGLDAEIASMAALERLATHLTTPELLHHRTHVTSYLYTHPQDFAVLGVTVHPDASDLRVTLDTREDLALIEALVERLGDRPPAWREVVSSLRKDASLVSINAGVKQKHLEEG
ncbi:MAG: NTP transferase domain-containing protein [Phycicoccus sp.]|nr:NTP transferase domain-containing protein [Phycicoccus sp.]